MKHASGTFLEKKLLVIGDDFFVVRHRCTPKGHKPDEKHIEAVVNWGPCRDLSDIRAFVGTIGVACIFIENFAK